MSGHDDLETPPDFYKAVRIHIPFDVDLAASSENTLCKRFISAEEDALMVSWRGRGHYGWINPPYSPGAGPLLKWVEKVHREVCIRHIRTVAMLMPCDPSADWFTRYFESMIVRAIKPRLRFLKDGKPLANSARWPSLLCIFGQVPAWHRGRFRPWTWNLPGVMW